MDDTTLHNDNPATPVSSAPKRRRSWDEVVYDWWMPKWKKVRGTVWVLFFLTLFLVVWLFDLIFVNIYPGNAGVLWRRFGGGTDMTRIYEGGLWVINPFNKMYIYETRVQQRETNFTALSSNGLIIQIRASVRFMPEKKHLPLLHEEVGPDYIDRVVIPQVQSVIRKIIGAYEPDQIYGTQGNILQNVVLTALGELRTRYIILDDLLIKEILLPEKVASAIEGKLEQEQLSLQFKYILEREEQEARRKAIEARGIQEFQRISSSSLTENYLRLRGIAATVELAKSPNAKVVIFGNNPSGLPLILNTGDLATPSPLAHPAVEAGTFRTDLPPGEKPPAPAVPPTPAASTPSPANVPPIPAEVKSVPAEVAKPIVTKP